MTGMVGGEGVWLLVWIWAVEDIFGTGGDVFCWWNGRLSCLFQKAAAIPQYEGADNDHEDDGSDDSTRESTLAHTARGGGGLLRIGYAFNGCALCAGPVRMSENVEFG